VIAIGRSGRRGARSRSDAVSERCPMWEMPHHLGDAPRIPRNRVAVAKHLQGHRTPRSASLHRGVEFSALPSTPIERQQNKAPPMRLETSRTKFYSTQLPIARPAGPSITLVARHVRVPVYEMPRAQNQLECCRAHNLPITHHNSGTGEFLCAACVTAAGGGARGLTPIQEAYKSEVRTMASFATYINLLLLLMLKKSAF